MDTPYLGLIVYLIIVGAVGLWTWGMNLTKEDFILGGRKLGAFVIAFSERTAAESSWLVLGLSGALFAVGLLELWTVVGCVSGIFLYWYVIARRLREVSEEHGAITLPELFFKLSGSHGQAVRLVSMLIIVFFFSFYIAAQFIGAGKVLDATFGLAPHWGMPLAAVVVVLYTMMGGFAAVCYTDVVQGFLMVFTLVVMPLVGLWYLDSHGLEMGPALAAAGDRASLMGGKTGWAAAAAVIGGLSWGLGYMGQPHLVTKFMAVNRADAIPASRRIALVWTVLAYGGAALIGVVGMALVYHGALPAAGLQGAGGDPERILPVMAGHLFPAWMAGILVSGAIAAMMSTADSQILIATSTLVEDVYCKAMGRNLSPKGLVMMSRVLTVAVGVVAFALAWVNDDLIYGVVSMAWTGLGSAFGPALVLTLHWKRMNGRGVLAGMIAGAATTIVWNRVPALEAILSARFSAFAIALAACIVAALSAPPAARKS